MWASLDIVVIMVLIPGAIVDLDLTTSTVTGLTASIAGVIVELSIGVVVELIASVTKVFIVLITSVTRTVVEPITSIVWVNLDPVASVVVAILVGPTSVFRNNSGGRGTSFDMTLYYFRRMKDNKQQMWTYLKAC